MFYVHLSQVAERADVPLIWVFVEHLILLDFAFKSLALLRQGFLDYTFVNIALRINFSFDELANITLQLKFSFDELNHHLSKYRGELKSDLFHEQSNVFFVLFFKGFFLQTNLRCHNRNQSLICLFNNRWF